MLDTVRRSNHAARQGERFMKRLLFLAFAIGGINCAVDSAPNPPPVSADDSELATTRPEVSDHNAYFRTSTVEPEAATPRFVDCNPVDTCESAEQCVVDGGFPGARCKLTGHCCMF